MTLLLCVCTGAWAASETVAWSGSSLAGTSGTNVTAGTATAVDGSTYKAGTISINSSKIVTESKKHTNDSYWEDFSSTPQTSSSTNATGTARIEFPITIATDYIFTVSEIDFMLEQGGGGGPAVHVFLVQGESSTWIGYTAAATKKYDELSIALSEGSAKLVFVLGVTSNFGNGRQFKLSGINIKGTSSAAAVSGPTLSGASSSPAANAAGIAVSGSGFLKFSKNLASKTDANFSISPSEGVTFSITGIDGIDASKVNYSWSGLKKETQYTINVAEDAVSDGTNGNSEASLKFTTIEKDASSFALTSAAEVEVAIDGTSSITTTGNAGTVTYESDKTSVATVTSAGVITAVAGGKATITVTDPGSDDVKSSTKTVTVLVPYANPAAATSYVLNKDTYSFSNTGNTKYYFTNGFTISLSSEAECQGGSLSKSIKYSHAREYTINVPSSVTVTWAEIKARNNYTSDKTAAKWGNVFGTNYISEGDVLPWSNEDPIEKDFVIASPSAGGTLVFQPSGNQIQGIITLHTDTYHAKKAVSYDKGTGTGTMTGTEKREGDTFTLPASTFTNPASKYFKGWLCSVDSKRYAAGDTYTMTDAATTFTAQYGVIEGTSMIKAVLQSYTSATITGSIGGTYSANDKVQARDNNKGGCKLGNDGAYVCITLASGAFQEGDIVQVNIGTAGSGGTFAFYKESAGTNAILTTEEGPTAGLHSFILPAAAAGETTFYIVRKSKSNFNPYVDYVEVYRPHIVTLNASGFATYSKDWDYKVQSGATMYKMALDISDPANPTIAGTAVTEAPAGAGVLLKGTAGDKAYILNSSQISALASNSLNGTTDANGDLVDIDKSTYDYYVLSGDTFKKYTGDAFGANKSFFQTANGALASARAFTITFDDGETTAIKAVEAKKFVEDNKFFNLAGQQVAQPTMGLYIVNGRKVVIK